MAIGRQCERECFFSGLLEDSKITIERMRIRNDFRFRIHGFYCQILVAATRYNVAKLALGNLSIADDLSNMIDSILPNVFQL